MDMLITGNLDIIANKDIKKLLRFGHNFREKQPINKVLQYLINRKIKSSC